MLITNWLLILYVEGCVHYCFLCSNKMDQCLTDGEEHPHCLLCKEQHDYVIRICDNILPWSYVKRGPAIFVSQFQGGSIMY